MRTFGYTVHQMETWFATHITQMLAWLSLPEFGLSTVFVISFFRPLSCHWALSPQCLA